MLHIPLQYPVDPPQCTLLLPTFRISSIFSMHPERVSYTSCAMVPVLKLWPRCVTRGLVASGRKPLVVMLFWIILCHCSRLTFRMPTCSVKRSTLGSCSWFWPLKQARFLDPWWCCCSALSEPTSWYCHSAPSKLVPVWSLYDPEAIRSQEV